MTLYFRRFIWLMEYLIIDFSFLEPVCWHKKKKNQSMVLLSNEKTWVRQIQKGICHLACSARVHQDLQEIYLLVETITAQDLR